MTSIFVAEDRPGGYKFVVAPEFPGFSAMLKPGEEVGDDHVRSLLTLVELDAVAAERERCAKIAESAINDFNGQRKSGMARAIARRIRDATNGQSPSTKES